MLLRGERVIKSPVANKRMLPMTPDDDRLAYVVDLIRHRCPELSEAEVAKFLAGFNSAPDDDREEMLPASIVGQIMQVLDRMIERQDRMEAQLAPAEPIPARLN
jgi:hypothetical protein